MATRVVVYFNEAFCIASFGIPEKFIGRERNTLHAELLFKGSKKIFRYGIEINTGSQIARWLGPGQTKVVKKDLLASHYEIFYNTLQFNSTATLPRVRILKNPDQHTASHQAIIIFPHMPYEELTVNFQIHGAAGNPIVKAHHFGKFGIGG